MFGSVSNFLLMSGELLPRKKVYTDAVNSLSYLCDADHGSVLTAKVWKIRKCHLDASGNIEEMWETDGYDNVATDLATVELLSFS